MPRVARRFPGRSIYHVGNTLRPGVPDMDADDRDRFATLLGRALGRYPRVCAGRQMGVIHLLAWVVLPRSWRLLLMPDDGGELSDLMRWLTMRHVQDWNGARGNTGGGSIYRGRFKAFPVEPNGGFPHMIARHMERSPVGEGLAPQPESWDASSARGRDRAWTAACACGGNRPHALATDAWPGERSLSPSTYRLLLDAPQPREEFERCQICVERSRPLGSPDWTMRVAEELNLTHTLRSRGRPKANARASSLQQEFERPPNG